MRVECIERAASFELHVWPEGDETYALHHLEPIGPGDDGRARALEQLGAIAASLGLALPAPSREGP